MAPFVKCTRGVIICCYLFIMSRPVKKVESREMKSANLILAEEDSSLISTAEGAWGKRNPGASNVTPTPRTQESTEQHGCWVFHHMVKSGGSTVRRLISYFSKHNKIVRSEYANSRWLGGIKGKRFAENIMRTGQGVVYGGYAEALRPIEGSDGCKWFTIFRHPVSRLVSAFFYCKHMNRKDPLCAQHQIDLDTIDLLSFAEHWGNYGLRQYALGFLSNEDILSSPVARECEQCPAWYIVKRYLQSIQQQIPDQVLTNSSIGLSTDEQSLYLLLKPALEIISSKYTAVGILEDMATTMRLFDSALCTNRFNWTVASDRLGTANEDHRDKAEEHATVHTALTDPTIISYISLDIILYEHAVNVRDMQVKQYGLDQI